MFKISFMGRVCVWKTCVFNY